MYHNNKNPNQNEPFYATLLVVINKNIITTHSGALLSNPEICHAGLFVKTYWAFGDIYYFKIISPEKVPSVYKEELLEEYEEHVTGNYSSFASKK